MWRFRGSSHYIGQQASRLGITQVLADRARSNPNICRMSVLLGQICERYHRARSENGLPVLYRTELDQVKGTLEQCEHELQKLYMLAGASSVMLDEAWEAFDLPKPRRNYGVVCDSDPPTLPLGDGTVGVLPYDGIACVESD